MRIDLPVYYLHQIARATTVGSISDIQDTDYLNWNQFYSKQAPQPELPKEAEVRTICRVDFVGGRKEIPFHQDNYWHQHAMFDQKPQ